tara:strand:+ start:1019 stop:1177 length:159 start_codon:yes stop_codon:yes gene_type:complete
MKVIKGVPMEDFKAFKVDCRQAEIGGDKYFVFDGRIYITKFAINLIKQYEAE